MHGRGSSGSSSSGGSGSGAARGAARGAAPLRSAAPSAALRPGGGGNAGGAAAAGALVLTEPVSRLDVDAELWEVLDLCSDEELEGLYGILFGASPFSPVVKSIVTEDEPALLQLRGRTSIMHKVEARFRFLAADSSATMRGKRPSYREALLLIRDRLGVECSSNLTTPDLESEVFLHVLQHCLEYVGAEGDPDPAAAAAVAYAAEGDGMTRWGRPAGRRAARPPPPGAAAGADTAAAPARSPRPRRSAPSGPPRSNWTERLTAPFRFGGRDLLPPALKLTSAVTLTAVMRRSAAQLGRQLLGRQLRYQAVAQAATSGAAGGVLAQWQRQAALAAAQRGLTSATLRYSAVQGALSLLGPVMWAWLAVDLVRAAVGTDYARVVRAVYVLAQVRLVATQGWSNPGSAGPARGDEELYV
ncbi:hypothetical protein HT031_003724 [Scenedesmus sp. PABB004]|nr:hypothetical protein HT031_003724 [Scenedesmus sp. PABB004]